MNRAALDGITLEYEDSGSGEPVVFIHGAFIADAFRPLTTEPEFANRYRLITYRRRGYPGSSRTAGPISTADQASDCIGLARHLGIARAHFVGHSFGGCVALQLALDFPELVQSLALLEPGLMVGASAAEYRASLQRAERRYREAGADVVTREFLKARWPDFETRLEAMLPGGFEQASSGAWATFELDFGLLDWQFGEAEARNISQPTLVVLGGDSPPLSPRFEETYRFLLKHVRKAEGFVLPGVTHFLHLESPTAARLMARVLTAFFERHPIT